MSTLTVEFKGVTDTVLNALIEKGYAKTKAEALRYALIHLGEELGLVEHKFHAKTEEYAYKEIKERFRRN